MRGLRRVYWTAGEPRLESTTAVNTDRTLGSTADVRALYTSTS